MRENGLASAYGRKRFKEHPGAVNEADVPNVVARGFGGRAPRTHICSDLAYVRVGASWSYACLLVDPCNREIVGHSAGPRKDARLVKPAFATLSFPISDIEVFHTDRGGEFDNNEIDLMLEAFGIERSLSAKGCPYDNAVDESTNRILKAELVHRETFGATRELRARLSDYVRWCNNFRNPLDAGLHVAGRVQGGGTVPPGIVQIGVANPPRPIGRTRNARDAGGGGAWRDGSTTAGVPRWRCRCCGRRFTSLTGTVLVHCRKPLPVWVSFIRPMRHNVPVECAAELCGITHKTAFEWRHRVLATVSGYQDRIVPRDTVWVDETYIDDTDLSKGYERARKRGLSRQKLCNCVAIDVHRNPVAVARDHGRPSPARVRKAMGGRIAPGSPHIHDLERAHDALVRGGGLESEAHRADANGPVYLERMEMVNVICCN